MIEKFVYIDKDLCEIIEYDRVEYVVSDSDNEYETLKTAKENDEEELFSIEIVMKNGESLYVHGDKTEVFFDGFIKYMNFKYKHAKDA